jgi:hypothetical protein
MIGEKIMSSGLKKEEQSEIENSENFETNKAENRDMAAFQEVEGMDNVYEDKEAEATFEKMMVARSKGAQ